MPPKRPFPTALLASFTSALPGANQFKLIRSLFTTSGHAQINDISFKPIGTHVYVRGSVSSGFSLILAGAGRTHNQIGTASGHSCHIFNSSKFTDRFIAFRFKDTTTGNTDYGYIETSLTDNSHANLNLHIIAYAYDASGAKIVTSPVPEPSAPIVLAAFSALTLGAVGVRRLKALRN